MEAKATVHSDLIRRAVETVAESWGDLIHRDERRGGSELSEREVPRLRALLAACADARGGEASTRKRIATLAELYTRLGAEGKTRFLRLLAEFAVRPAVFAEPLAELESNPDVPAAASRLRDALEPPWLRILRSFNVLENGTKFLVDLRADVLERSREFSELRPLEADLRELLATWFDLGFLELRRITWDAPASLLEKLARYEAVHEVRGWLGLKDRLDTDRRCFAYLHPAMPNEPLVFVEVALTDHLPDRIAPLIDPKAPRGDAGAAKVAAFYSISACQQGLAGISFGNALIKGVVSALSAEHQHLRTFTTLSPIPGFRAWLDAQPEQPGWNAESRALLERPGWPRDAALELALERPLLRLCARYLLEARGRDGAPLDPVERFHLSNGARLERLCWLGDRSAKGLRESAGLMVNYLYRLDEIETNQEAYGGTQTIAASRTVRELAREPLETPRLKRPVSTPNPATPAT